MMEILDHNNRQPGYLRLQGFDYSQNGAYFTTICTKNRVQYFGSIVQNILSPNDISNEQIFESAEEIGNRGYAYLEESLIGKKAKEFWLSIPEHFPYVSLDEFQIMPNHIHGILLIHKNGQHLSPISQDDEIQYAWQPLLNKKNQFGPQSKNLSSILRGFKAGLKSYATKHAIPFKWHPRFFDRIIRNEDELNRIRNYIITNPDNWHLDQKNDANLFM